MSPVDPSILRRYARADQQPPEIGSCGACGYDLAGLGGVDRCPECGTIIEASLGVPGDPASRRQRLATGDTISAAPIAYLRTLLAGFALLALSLPVIQVSLFLLRWGLADLTVGAAMLIVSGLVWWLGVWIVTGPRRSTLVPIEQRLAEHRKLRLANRIIQGLWLLAGVMVLVVVAYGGTSLETLGRVLFNVFLLGATFGLAALCEQLRAIALWTGDDELGERLNFAAWGVAGCGAWILVAPFIAAIAGPAAVLIGFSAVAASVLFLFANLVLIYCLYKFVPMLRWAIVNWAELQHRNQRRADRYAARQEGQPEPPPVARPRPVARYDESPIPLAEPDPE